MIVCGRAGKWWESEKIKCRRELHKRMINGQGSLWGEYCRLRKGGKVNVSGQKYLKRKKDLWILLWQVWKKA